MSDGVSGGGGRKSKIGGFGVKIRYSDRVFVLGSLDFTEKVANIAHPDSPRVL
jgi:hypothetical protein